MTKHLYSMANALLKGDQGQVDAAFKEAVHDKMRTRLELARKDVAERRFAVESKDGDKLRKSAKEEGTTKDQKKELKKAAKDFDKYEKDYDKKAAAESK